MSGKWSTLSISSKPVALEALSSSKNLSCFKLQQISLFTIIHHLIPLLAEVIILLNGAIAIQADKGSVADPQKKHISFIYYLVVPQIILMSL
jgi:hypothetical protein